MKSLEDFMRYFQPVQIVDRTVYFNPNTFVHTQENLNRMRKGSSPIGVDGKHVTLHHIGRSHNSKLATLTDTFHSRHSNKIHNLAPPNGEEVNRKKFRRERKNVWKGIWDYLTQDLK